MDVTLENLIIGCRRCKARIVRANLSGKKTEKLCAGIFALFCACPESNHKFMVWLFLLFFCLSDKDNRYSNHSLWLLCSYVLSLEGVFLWNGFLI